MDAGFQALLYRLQSQYKAIWLAILFECKVLGVKVEESEHIVYIIPKVGERRNKQECMHIKKLKRVNKHKQRVAELNHHQNDNTQ